MGKIYLKKYKNAHWKDGKPICVGANNNWCYFWDKDCGKYVEICCSEGVIFKQVEPHKGERIK